MKALSDRIVKALVTLILPQLLQALTEAVEEAVKVDLNGDGVVGFPVKKE